MLRIIFHLPFMIIILVFFQFSILMAQKSPEKDAKVVNSCLIIQELLPGNPGNKTGVRLKNGSYEIFASEYKTYGYKIIGNKEGLVADGGLPGGANKNTVYKFVGKSTIKLGSGSSYIFEGEKYDPISFVLMTDNGLTYIGGKGKVTLNDSTIVKLPCPK